MRILLLTWFFPPTNAIGAVRTGKFARHLMQEGHDLRVVTVRNSELPSGLPLEIPASQVIHTPWFDVNSAPRALARLLRPGDHASPSAAAPVVPPALRAPARSRLHRAAQLYTAAINLPDRQIGWLPWALWGLRRACTDWRPDLIFASGPPFTTFLAARHAGRRLGVPWVAELRDRWVDDPYDDDPPWRAAALTRLERLTLGSASALVTVSEPWAEWYRHKYAKPVAAIHNGFDPDETEKPAEGEKTRWFAPGPLTIVYTGVIYPGFRDPTPLFAALRLIPQAADRLRVVFYGTAPDHVRPIAAACGVLPLIELRPAVPRAEALRIQRAADILLLMQWTDPRDQGHIPAKLFEYLAALRPILGLGLEDGVPARLIRERAAGCFSNDPEAIAAQLKTWLAIHEQDGRVPDLPVEARRGLSRREQYARLEAFLADLLRAHGPQPPNKAA